MRLAAKIVVALCFVVVSGLVVQAVLGQRQVTELYDHEARDDVRILTGAVSSAASQIWSLLGEEKARAYLESADERRTHVRIKLLPPGASRQDGPFHRGDEVVMRAPLVVGGTTVALAEVARSRSAERKYLVDMRRTQLWTTFLLVVACIAVAMILGVWLIGRPVEHLVAYARQIGDGAYPEMDEAKQRDEIGRLAREMKSMADKLQAASAKATSEHRGRAALLEQLRHADRLSTVGKIASSIAHEMGTPLNVVSGRAMMIASGNLSEAEIAQSAKTISEQANRLSAIIKELLQFSRRRGLQKVKTRLGDVLEHAKNLAAPLAEEHSIAIAISDHEGVAANIDAGKTLQVLTNLMVNAIQAMPDGGTIRMGAQTESVEKPPERRAKPGDYVCITVADSGTGIGHEDLEHIFEPFFTTKRARDGTGLGLSVCHGIVREHGGWIAVDSKVGEGTKFSVYLPQEDTA